MKNQFVKMAQVLLCTAVLLSGGALSSCQSKSTTSESSTSSQVGTTTSVPSSATSKQTTERTTILFTTTTLYRKEASKVTDKDIQEVIKSFEENIKTATDKGIKDNDVELAARYISRMHMFIKLGKCAYSNVLNPAFYVGYYGEFLTNQLNSANRYAKVYFKELSYKQQLKLIELGSEFEAKAIKKWSSYKSQIEKSVNYLKSGIAEYEGQDAGADYKYTSLQSSDATKTK